MALGAKGCVLFGPAWPTDHRTALRASSALARGHWLVQLKHGVLTAPSGKWFVAAAHTPGVVDEYVGNLRDYLDAVGLAAKRAPARVAGAEPAA